MQGRRGAVGRVSDLSISRLTDHEFYLGWDFCLKKYNRIKCVSKDDTKIIFMNLCFRTCVCNFVFMNLGLLILKVMEGKNVSFCRLRETMNVG